MVGDHLLVAPLFAGEPMRQVILSKGKWYDFYTVKYVGEGETFDCEKGSFGCTKLEVKNGKDQQSPTQGQAWRYGGVRWEYMTK